MIVGTFAVSHVVRLASPRLAVVLAAIYLLWSYQRVAYGPVRDEHRNLPTCACGRSSCSRPVLALLLVFGVYPKLLTRPIDPATTAVIEHVDPQGQTTDVGARSSTCRRRRASSRPVPAADEVGSRMIPTRRSSTCARSSPSSSCAGFAIVGLLYEAIARRSDRGRAPAIALAGIVAAAGASLLAVGSGPASRTSWATCRGRRVLRRDARGAAGGGRDRRALRHALLLALGRRVREGSSIPLMLFATAGMTLITAANDLIVVFLALEILSLSLYVLTGITGRRSSNEAAMKYFLLGAFSSAFFLYGVAMAYGATDTTKITGDRERRSPGRPGRRRSRCSRSPSSWSGSCSRSRRRRSTCGRPTCTRARRRRSSAFMAAATKVAAFFALIRVLDVALPAADVGLDAGRLIALAVVSVVVGQRARDRADATSSGCSRTRASRRPASS